MSKVRYVTGNIHKIGDHAPEQTAEADGGKFPPEENAPHASGVPPKRERLSQATEEALQRRHEEFLRFRKDLLFRMEKLACEVRNAHEKGERLLAETKGLEEEVRQCRSQLEECGEPDADDRRYQVILAEKCRLLDQLRLTVIQLDSKLGKNITPLSGSGSAAEKETNLFAQMDSLSKRQLLRLGLWLFFPCMLILFFSALIVGLLVMATFRLGL